MAINDDVFRALLAMDSYNRGYNPGIALAARSPYQSKRRNVGRH